MGKIAKSTCTKCHMTLPRTEMYQVSETYVSGASFGSKTKSGRSTNRVYTRSRKVWVCTSCYNQQSRFKLRIMWVGLILAIGLGIWSFS